MTPMADAISWAADWAWIAMIIFSGTGLLILLSCWVASKLIPPPPIRRQRHEPHL